MLILKGLMCDQNAKNQNQKSCCPDFILFSILCFFSLCAILLFGERKEKPYEKDNVFFTYNTLTVIGFLL